MPPSTQSIYGKWRPLPHCSCLAKQKQWNFQNFKKIQEIKVTWSTNNSLNKHVIYKTRNKIQKVDMVGEIIGGGGMHSMGREHGHGHGHEPMCM